MNSKNDRKRILITGAGQESMIGESTKTHRRDWIVATKFGHAYEGSTQKTDS
jgi:aryl-alcohol dehydrogenase-like predicted oxidoreductase